VLVPEMRPWPARLNTAVPITWSADPPLALVFWASTPTPPDPVTP